MSKDLITKTKEFESVEELKNELALAQKKAQSAVNEYNSLLIASFGSMPKNELALVDFIEKVLKHYELLK